MVVVPINADVGEAQNVAQEHRQQRLQRCPVRPLRHFHFQHHNGDDDGDDAVAEGFEAIRFHIGLKPRRAATETVPA